MSDALSTFNKLLEERSRPSDSKTFNVAGFLTELQISDPHRSNPSNDIAVIKLLHGIENLNAGDIVQVRMRPEKETKGDNAKRDIYMLGQRYSASAPAVEMNSTLRFDKCYIDRDGVLNARYVKPLVHVREKAKQKVWPAYFTSVMSFSEAKDGNKAYQHIQVFSVNQAKVINSMDDMYTMFNEHMQRTDFGTPGLLFRAITVSGDIRGIPEFVFPKYAKNDQGEWVREPLQDTGDRFFNSKLITHLQSSFGGDQLYFEMIPVLRYPVGAKSLQKPEYCKRMAAPFTLMEPTPTKDGNIVGKQMQGVAQAHTSITRVNENVQAWVATDVSTLYPFNDKVYPPQFIPTPNLNDYMLERCNLMQASVADFTAQQRSGNNNNGPQGGGFIPRNDGQNNGSQNNGSQNNGGYNPNGGQNNGSQNNGNQNNGNQNNGGYNPNGGQNNGSQNNAGQNNGGYNPNGGQNNGGQNNAGQNNAGQNNGGYNPNGGQNNGGQNNGGQNNAGNNGQQQQQEQRHDDIPMDDFGDSMNAGNFASGGGRDDGAMYDDFADGQSFDSRDGSPRFAGNELNF